MKDEQQLHGASPELSLHHIVVKSDLKTRRGAAERKVDVSRQKMTEKIVRRVRQQTREIKAFA